MDWVKQLNEAINYIEENLSGEISYETISRIICYLKTYQKILDFDVVSSIRIIYEELSG